ncbi:MAG: DNA repair protein RecN [Prevotellaceae bacterium]|jgi:DNA repair protein RecN (Recombination protein N)|nr:DNA repair protein RecN [Prevotellaceae bacterium]
MLKTLTVENYALIDKSVIHFPGGFSVITGETGAGKSILLGALNLILGQKSDARFIKYPDKKCVIESIFDLSTYRLQPFFEENELDYDDECIVRREIAPNGKSRSFVNDTPVAISVLKELGEKLIDIHSQHKNLLLNDNRFQLNIVDTVAGNRKELEHYRNLYSRFCNDKKRLKQLIDETNKKNADKDFLDFQLNQLKEANLSETEQEELEAEAAMLTHSEEIKAALSKSLWLLSENEQNINANLKEAIASVQAVSAVFPASEDVAQRLASCFIELKEITRELDSMQNDVEVNPQQLEYINSRLDTIYSLEKKHNVSTVKELLQLQQSLEEQFQQLDFRSEEIERLSKDIENQETALRELAQALSEKRKTKAPEIEHEIVAILRNLGMPNARLSIRFDPKESFSADGIDEVNFLFSANKDRVLQPIATIASGGEISRVMLSLKSVISRSSGLPIIILDEIDTGVSGEIADKMGTIMQEMGKTMQVISITHLPQIASKGTVHYKVFKTDNEKGVTSNIKQLSAEERVTEIAQMLSGTNLTEAAIRNAEELLGR